jgi:hypothetical protein
MGAGRVLVFWEEWLHMQQCPICHSSLTKRRVAPCYDCGHAEQELIELAEGEHEYNELLAFGRHKIILCDFCDADFASYSPSWFGKAGDGTIGRVLELVRPIDPSSYPFVDGYCEACGKRLAYLKFLADVRKSFRSTGSTD